MSKYINEDAEKLTKYFKEFELKNIFLNSEFVDEFKKVHKKTLGYLVIYFEIEKQNKRSKFFQEKAIYYLKESVSDILQSFFCWINGAYKASDLLLRSSIENFNKAIIGNINDDVYTEKSVYKIFDMANKLDEYKILIVMKIKYQSTMPADGHYPPMICRVQCRCYWMRQMLICIKINSYARNIISFQLRVDESS